MKGFAHPGYADSLAEFGTPRELPRCGGWVLERPIPGTSCLDAMGCYPLFVCRDWTQLPEDLAALESDVVCLSLVTDPFGQFDVDLLRRCFDKVVPFKEHFIADLDKPANTFVSSHHRYYTRKALRNVTIDICEEPIRYLEEWTELYGGLVKKFNIKGIRAFSETAFKRQLSIPGTVMFRALHGGTTVAAHLVFVQNEICYGHLVGINPSGNELLASYALYWTEIEYFAGKARWFDWGAGAGISSGNGNGLTQFKRGWSSEARPTYFCGRVFNRERYDDIRTATGNMDTDYFPAYRKGEFG